MIDESYNANPASMAATIRSLGAERDVERRIAVLGPMRELGPRSDELHAELAAPLVEAKVDELVLVGEETAPARRGAVGRASDVSSRRRRGGPPARPCLQCSGPATQCWSRRPIRSACRAWSSG